MDIFGSRWNGYLKKIEDNWKERIKRSDTVVIAGDISWAMDTEELKADFDFLEKLPGEKIIMKGNHDYWWQTMAKLEAFISVNNYKTIKFLYNNAYLCEDFIICGSRGWYSDEKNNPIKGADSKKIIAREVGRLKMSLDAGVKLRDEQRALGYEKEILVFLHFPAIFKGYMCDDIINELYKKSISRCFYGHIHGNYDASPKITYADINFYLISADYLAFIPYRIEPLKY